MLKADVGFRAAFGGFRTICETFGYEALAALTAWIGCADENLFREPWARMAGWEAQAFERNFSVESLAETMDIHANTDLTADLARLQIPVLLLLGDSGQLGASRAGVRSLIEEFRARAPQTEVATVAAAGGTYCMIERPAETVRVLRGFLARI